MKFTRNRIFILLVSGAAVLGITGGLAVASALTTAYAHGGAQWGSGGGSLAARIAEKLNDALELDEDITGAQVQTAFDQVTADRQEEILEARIDELEVEDAAKTEILDWFDDYPYADLIRFRTIGLASSDHAAGFLERLVEREKITQDQSDGIHEWYEARPDLPDGLERSRRGRHHRGGNGPDSFFRGRFGRGHDGADTFFRGRFGRGGNGDADARFRGRYHHGGSTQVEGSPL